jgi:hypothetical protein
MPGRSIQLPQSGFAIEIDGLLKTEFSTGEGAMRGALELKRRFSMLQLRAHATCFRVSSWLAVLGSGS